MADSHIATTAGPAIDGYAQIRTISRGERMVVHRAIRSEDGRPVVLKCLAPGCSDPRARARLLHEYAILRDLDLPGVVRAYRLMATDLGPTLEMDDAGTRNLRRAAPETVTQAWFLEIAVRLARIVADVHARDITHRDLNPANIMLEGGPETLTLIDFGLASRIKRQTAEQAAVGTLEGTIGYLSPEQTGRMNRSIDRRTDLYSLGVTLFELLTGRLPFVSSDPLAVLHATVAVVAPPVSDFRLDVAPAITAIIARLLEKDAERRYQHAAALAEDLAHCQAALAAGAPLTGFELGASDRRATFLVAERMYGREADIAALEAAYHRALAGRTTFVGIAGPPGIGKSSLVRELLPRMEAAGLLVAGVCNPVQRTPYAPVLAVLREMVGCVLTASEELIAAHTSSFQRAVADEGALLGQILPELAAMLGQAQPLPEMGAGETRERVQALLIRLLCCIHSQRLPVVVFLDDLQWADPGTLELLRRIMADLPSGGPLFLLAWRDSEVGSAHPLLRVLPADLEQVAPAPLDAGQIGRFLSDTLAMPPTDTHELAACVLAKTGGNAFFVRGFVEALHADGLLRFDIARQRWTWNLAAIAELQATANVAELLGRRIATLDPAVRLVLGTAACLGIRFDIDMLWCIVTQPLAELAQALLQAVDLGLLSPLGSAGAELELLASGAQHGEAPTVRGSVQFVHDAVFDASLLMLGEDRRRDVFVRHAKLLLARWTPDADPFPVADALNRALAGLSEEERAPTARINLLAGQRAYASAAFDAALHYFGAGCGLVRPGDWSADHANCFALHLGAALALLMARPPDSAADYAAEAMAHAQGEAEKLAVAQVRIRQSIARYAFAEAIAGTLEALRWAGVDLPQQPNAGHVAVALATTMWRSRSQSLPRLRTLPPNRDALAVAAMGLLADGTSSAYYTSAFLLPVMLCRMVDLTLRRGVCGQSAYGFAAFAFMQLAVRGNVAAAWMWAQAAREVVARMDARDMAAKVEVLVIGFVESRREPLADLIDRFVAAGQLAREVGDAEYMGLSAMNRSTFSLMAGVPLREVAERMDEDLATSRRAHQEQCVNMILAARQTVACLMGQAADPAQLSGEFMDRDAMIERMTARRDKSGVAEVRFYQLRLSLLFGTAEALREALELAAPCTVDVPASPSLAPFYLHSALGWVRWMRQTGARGRPLRLARKYLKILRSWAMDGPDNHTHKVLLVQAALAELAGDVAASGMYDAAIRQAQRSGMLHEQALCLEWAAGAALRAGQLRHAALLLEDARGAWLGWGCKPRLAALAELESQLEGSHLRPWAAEHRGLQRSSTQMDGTHIDILSVVKAARVLSSETDLAVLLRDLMRIVVENAGATSAALALQTDSGLGIVATAATTAEGVTVTLTVPKTLVAPESLHIAWAPLIRYVARTVEPVVVPDGSRDMRFFRGCAEPPLSALCVPLVRGGEMVGVMLVTNELARYAFTEDRHEVVGLICAQAAVSIINARLYDDLRLSLEHQQAITSSFERFVPKAFLEQLGRGSIMDVALGDQVLREMAVLFMDIRGFTAISEQLTPPETFDLVNSLLARLGPIVTANGGFIDKYIGDAIMALFPRAPDDALHAALQIQAAVGQFRGQAKHAPHNQLRVGVGVHCGPMMLGTIGERERMEGTVISDAVNIASRLEGLTKDFAVEILVSEGTAAGLLRPGDFELRYLGQREMKGRQEPLGICQLVSGRRSVPADARSSALRAIRPVGG